MEVLVRWAVPEDAAGIAAVHVRSWQVAYRGLMPDALLDGLSISQRQGAWRERLAGDDGPGAVLVAERDEALVGFCAIAMPSRDADQPGDVAEIGAMYVDPDMWRDGIGGMLMEAAIAHLVADRWREVTLWVLIGNQPALDFYARFGFASDGAQQRYERSATTGLRLRRPLSA